MRVLQDETVFVLLNNANEKQISHFSFLISHFSLYLCTRLQKARAFSSAGLEHLPYKQRVGGSNPSTPTKEFRSNSELFFVKYQKKGVAAANYSLFTFHFSLLFRTFAPRLRK